MPSADLFDKYISTHTGHRDGLPSIAAAELLSVHFDGQLGPLLPSDRTGPALDLGAGWGAIVWWLRRRGFADVTGLDFSSENVEWAARLGIDNVQKGDLRERLQDAEATYGLIVFRDVLEHFPREEMLEILRLTARALRPGGQVLIQVPNAESPFGGRIRYGDLTHELGFSVASLQQAFALVGLSDARFRGTRPVGRSPAQLVRRSLWMMVEAVWRVALFAELGRGQQHVLTQCIVASAVRR